MCIVLFIASDEPLPLPAWGPVGRDLSVCAANWEPDATAIFSKKHLYSAGTRQTGDGCGFSGDYLEAQLAREELAAFLDRALQRVLELELYVAWHDFGESEVRPRRFDQIGPSDIRSWMTRFVPEDFFLVLRED